jgi:hypothetical protein
MGEGVKNGGVGEAHWTLCWRGGGVMRFQNKKVGEVWKINSVSRDEPQGDTDFRRKFLDVYHWILSCKMRDASLRIWLAQEAPAWDGRRGT